MTPDQTETLRQLIEDQHRPVREPEFSLIDWVHCSCDARGWHRTRRDEDGYGTYGPVEWEVCPARLELLAALDG